MTHSAKLIKSWSAASAFYVLIMRLKPDISVWANMHFGKEMVPGGDRLCGLVVRVLGYRSGGPGSILGTTKKKK
jgi:hypothetical protein